MQGFSLEKLVKKVQGAIPVVSLLSKLLSPEGGIGSESLSYNEYCRAKLDMAGGTDYGTSLSELCDLHAVTPRQLLLLTWMVYEVGLHTCVHVESSATYKARKRLISTLEPEIDILVFKVCFSDTTCTVTTRATGCSAVSWRRRRPEECPARASTTSTRSTDSKRRGTPRWRR
jgi:hypothetical protein